MSVLYHISSDYIYYMMSYLCRCFLSCCRVFLRTGYHVSTSVRHVLYNKIEIGGIVSRTAGS